MSDGPKGADLRHITDARAMRALAHPVRLALLEALAMEGPLTATEAAELVGETPTTCSFHLRQLARFGFVEEAGHGPGRRRPWRMASTGNVFASETGDPEADVAASALEQLFRQRILGHLEEWTRSRSSYPREWRDLAQSSEFALFVTADELRHFESRLLGLFMEYQSRIGDPSQRPPGAVPVLGVYFLHPLRLPDGRPPSHPTNGERSPADGTGA